MRQFLLLILVLCSLKYSHAQHQDVFPGLMGDDLLEQLINTYKLDNFPDQAQNRDILFGEIDNKNDSLRCVYTGFKIYLNPNADPTQAAFDLGINTEHIYPKSLGSEGFAEGDMHHLRAARADVNNDRGNLPFGEIPDNETENWYYLNLETSAIPSVNTDFYSERKDGLFEPPEAQKGNIARAMMYFYTMYKDAADAANPNYFETQREDLCAWHYLDPVDQEEWDRTWKIAEYQEDKPNPFVLDCTLAERSYCGEFGEVCELTSVTESSPSPVLSIDNITPNPIRDGATFYFHTKMNGTVLLEIFDVHGKKLVREKIENTVAGENVFYWENQGGIPPGMVVCQLSLINNKKEQITAIKKAVVIK